MASSTAVAHHWPPAPLPGSAEGPAKRRRLSTTQDDEDIHLMLQWASNASVRAGWELFSKLRDHGVNPSTKALTVESDAGAASSTAHYAITDSLAKEAILKTLEQRRSSRHPSYLRCCLTPDDAKNEQPNDKQPSRWASLPLDVAIQVMGKLHAGDVHRAACVCNLYKDVIGCIVSGLSFSWCHSEGREINAVVRGAAFLFSCLESVSLARHAALQDDSICKLLSANSGKLQKLDLSGCSQITDVTLQHIAQHCRGLQILDVSSCTKLSNSMFVRIGKACPNLKVLNACGCERLTDTGLMALSIHCNQLREINLGWCHRISNFGLCCLARGCPDLQVVDLCGCHRLGDQAIIALAMGCPGLRSLGLHCLRHLTNVTMICLAAQLTGLRSLNVSGCVLLGMEAVQAVLESCPGLHTCSSRRSVIVSGCVGLSRIQCPCHAGRNNA